MIGRGKDQKNKKILTLIIILLIVAAVAAAGVFAFMKLREAKESFEEPEEKTQTASAVVSKKETKGVKLTPAPSKTPEAKKTPAATKEPEKKVEVLKNIDDIKAGQVIEKEKLDLKDLDKYFTVSDISDEIFDRICGDDKSYKTYCTVPREDLVYLKMLHVGFDKKIHVGEMIVNRVIADDIIDIFKTLFENDYQIEKMLLVDDFNADDRLSIDANNTSAFNFRSVTNAPGVLSYHGMGVAVDVNPINNPYVWYDESGNLTWEDRDAGLYLDRNAADAKERHMINYDDLCYKLFTEHGFTWGGDFSDPLDYQHFEKPIVQYSMY